MSSLPEFSSQLARHFERFVALKRACGAFYVAGAALLAQFDRYLSRKRASLIDKSVIDGFVRSVQHLSPRGQDNLFCVVWEALESAHRHGAPVRDLPARPRPSLRLHVQRHPYVLTDAEIERLLRVAGEKRRRSYPLCPATHTTLIGLLLTTGLRIGEAVALDVKDVDMRESVLVVRAGKFRKDRLLPLTSSTMDGVQGYLRLRRRHGRRPAPETPLFVTSTGRRYSTKVAGNAFREIVRRAGIRDRAGRCPRLHDLRHTFAVRRVSTWHEERRDANQLLYLLSTYMGHVNVSATQVYLQPNLQLLTAAGQRFEAVCGRRARRGRKAGA